jgi:FAD synthetase
VRVCERLFLLIALRPCAHAPTSRPSPSPPQNSPSGVAFSFNGGKDSTVILHLLRAALETLQKKAEKGEADEDGEATTTRPPLPIRTFIFDRPDDFPAVRAFVDAMDAACGLGVHHLTSSPADGEGWKGMAASLGRYLSSSSPAPVQAVLLGTRRGDPNAPGQAEFCPSSPGWPPFMRVNPILDWAYADVWGFIDGLKLPYCSLYDAGYTSLGSVGSTAPNAALARPGGGFAPARCLADGRQERAGRGAAVKAGGPPPPCPAPTRTAAVLLVGDELLAARVEEANARFLCGRLHAAGWRVARVAILPDDEAAVAAEVSAASAACTAVIVAGGVGPTADDVTMAAVGRAFGLPLARDPDLEARLRAWFGPGRCTAAHLKMADAPEGVVAIEVVGGGGEEDGENGRGGGVSSAAAGPTDANAAAAAASPPKPSPFPLLAVRNAFILPGVPALLRRKWAALEAALAAAHGPCAPFHSAALRLALEDETAVAPALAAATEAAGGAATVGSYPLHPPAKNDGATVVLVVEGKDAGVVGAVVCAARGALEADPATAGCVLALVDGAGEL